MNTSENHLHEFLRIFFANRRLIKRTFLVCAAISLVIPLLTKVAFDVSAEIVVQSKKLSQIDASTTLNSDTDKFVPPTLADMETESTMLRSPSLIRTTLQQMIKEGYFVPQYGLLDTWVKQPLRQYVIQPLQNLFGQSSTQEGQLETLTDLTLQSLSVITLPGSNVLSVTYSTADPESGVVFVNHLLDNYLSNRQQLQSTELPTSFYEQKRDQYRNQLDLLQQKRLSLLSSNNMSDPTAEIGFTLQAINTEEQSLNQLHDQSLENQKLISYLKKNLDVARNGSLTEASFPFTFGASRTGTGYDDVEIRQLTTQLTDLIGRYGDTSAAFQQNSLPMKQLREQIQRTREQLMKVIGNRVEERQNELNTTLALIAQKTQRIEDYKQRVLKLQEVQAQLAQLDTEITSLHSIFSAYTQRYEESRTQQVLNAQSASNARILSRPYEPTKPSTPSAMAIIGSGLITAIFLSLALGYIREFFDHRFKHPGQISQRLNLPVLLVINDQQTVSKNPHKRWTLAWMRYWISH